MAAPPQSRVAMGKLLNIANIVSTATLEASVQYTTQWQHSAIQRFTVRQVASDFHDLCQLIIGSG